MLNFHWRNEYDLGVSALDTAHRKIFALAGTVAQHALAEASKEEMAASLHELIECTTLHFADEERLMDESGFLDDGHHNTHLHQHEELLGQLHRFAGRLLADDHKYDLNRTLVFLHKWVTLHIVHSDIKLAAHLLSRDAIAQAAKSVAGRGE